MGSRKDLESPTEEVFGSGDLVGHHPGGNPGANIKSISHRCCLFEVVFVWELTTETIVLPPGSFQDGAISILGDGM
jgi:hypothetical protein